MSVPQIDITPESKMNLNFDLHSSCFFVIVGGKYINKIGDVLEKVNSVAKDLGIRPIAVFLISNYYKEYVIVDIDYGFERYKSTPVMVKYLLSGIIICTKL